MDKEKQVLSVFLRNYTKISYKGGIAKVIFDDCFEDMAEEIVKLFAKPHVSNCGDVIPYDSLSDSFKKSIDIIEDNLTR